MKRKEGYITRKIGKTYIVFRVIGQLIKTEEIVFFNGTGAYLWEKLEQEITLEELLKAVLLEYDIDKETAKAHIQEFLKQGLQTGILCN